MKKLSALSLKKCVWLVFLLAALLAAFLAVCTPLFSDDYYFASLGLHSSRDILHFAIHYDDGRVLGNAGIVAFLDHPALLVLTKALLTGALAVAFPLALGCRNKLSYVLSFLLVFGLSPAVFSQSVTWDCGFQNYLPPTVLLCVCYLMWRRADTGSAGCHIARAIGIFLIAFVSQLYMENNAIVSVLAAAAALVAAAVRHNKRGGLIAALWLVGSGLGALILFFLPKYVTHDVVRFTTFYRDLYIDSLSAIFGALWRNGLRAFDYVADCCVLCTALGLTSLGILLRTKNAWKHSGCHRAACLVSLALPIWSVGQRMFFSLNTRVKLYESQQLLFALLCFAFVFVFICALVHWEDKSRLPLVCILIALAGISAAPMLLTSIFSQRCLFLFCCLMGCAALVGFDALCDRLPRKTREHLGVIAVVGMCLLSLGLGGEYLAIRQTETEMLSYLTQKLDEGATEIKLCRIPSEYVFRDTSSFLGNYYYRETPNDTQYTFTDYGSWKAQIELEQNLKNR